MVCYMVDKSKGKSFSLNYIYTPPPQNFKDTSQAPSKLVLGMNNVLTTILENVKR